MGTRVAEPGGIDFAGEPLDVAHVVPKQGSIGGSSQRLLKASRHWGNRICGVNRHAGERLACTLDQAIVVAQTGMTQRALQCGIGAQARIEHQPDTCIYEQEYAYSKRVSMQKCGAW